MEALSFFLVGLGSGIKEFKDASKEPSEEEDTKIEP
jgi:hypothetical protein